MAIPNDINARRYYRSCVPAPRRWWSLAHDQPPAGGDLPHRLCRRMYP